MSPLDSTALHVHAPSVTLRHQQTPRRARPPRSLDALARRAARRRRLFSRRRRPRLPARFCDALLAALGRFAPRLAARTRSC